jgi:D-glycerate 3-kinase
LDVPPGYTELLAEEIAQRSLPADFIETIERCYFPLAQQIQRQKQSETLLVSFNGAQGSGKSTLTVFLRLILTHHFHLYTVEISIDDFYLTRQQRMQLAKDIHPLLATRGVPGTHDVDLAVKTIQCLQNCSAQQPCSIPQFDKAIDDRSPKQKWRTLSQPVDVILFEGWCNHAPVQAQEDLLYPVNRLESKEDAQGIWRRYANEQLKIYHQKLFKLADLLVFLKIPSFEKVYEWRGLQEKKLTKQADSAERVMDENQLRRFIEHYERITRHCLKTLPAVADIVISLDDSHSIQSIETKR